MLNITDVELTPNPHALKFVMNKKLLNFETRQFHNNLEAENDPFAKNIFAISGIVSVFYMDKFVTIEKEKQANWGQVQKAFISFLNGFNESLIPAEKEIQTFYNNDNELLILINEVLDKRVKPALAGDGGGLEVLGIDGYKVKIHYQGACGSCPTSISGTLMAIEGLLKRDVHPAIQVEAS